jgi:hypothetical protein
VRTGTRSSEQSCAVPCGCLNTGKWFRPTSYLHSMSDARTRAESRVAAVVDYWIDDALVRARPWPGSRRGSIHAFVPVWSR